MPELAVVAFSRVSAWNGAKKHSKTWSLIGLLFSQTHKIVTFRTSGFLSHLVSEIISAMFLPTQEALITKAFGLLKSVDGQNIF